jgi:hypothetical protein
MIVEFLAYLLYPDFITHQKAVGYAMYAFNKNDSDISFGKGYLKNAYSVYFRSEARIEAKSSFSFSRKAKSSDDMCPFCEISVLESLNRL